MAYPASSTVASGDAATATQYTNLRSDALAAKPVKTVIKPSDQTVNNSSTLVDDTALTFAIAANKKWICDILLYITSVTLTPDFKLQINVPAGATLKGLADGIYLSGVTQRNVQQIVGGSPYTFNDNTNTLVNTILIHIAVTNGANAGNVTLQWAQASATVEDTKVLAGSYLIATQVI